MYCSDCKKIIECSICANVLIYYEEKNSFQCNSCGHEGAFSNECRYCKAHTIELQPKGVEGIEQFFKTHIFRYSNSSSTFFNQSKRFKTYKR